MFLRGSSIGTAVPIQKDSARTERFRFRVQRIEETIVTIAMNNDTAKILHNILVIILLLFIF